MSPSPRRSPARFLPSPKGLGDLFQEVSGNLQKRTEGVSRAVQAAADEVRRNVNNFQSGSLSPRDSLDATRAPPSPKSTGQEDVRRRLSIFEKRNKALAKMLADALEELRSQKEISDPKQATVAESSFNIALAKIQFVHVYLADSGIQIPGHDGLPLEGADVGQPRMTNVDDSAAALPPDNFGAPVLPTQPENATPERLPTSPIAVARNLNRARDEGAEESTVVPVEGGGKGSVESSKSSLPKLRPALAHSPLSWILGAGQHRSDFVSSSTPPPEQRRDSVPRVKPKRLFPDGKDGEGTNDSESEDNGFTMSSLHHSQSKT